MNLPVPAVQKADSRLISANFDGETDHGYSILVKYVHALAKRQAQIDAQLCAANDNQPRTLN
jgi:roadblock/LC7 domain-containing protein